MHSSGPRPKSHCGSPTMMSSPTLAGSTQLRCAVPAAEFPVGWQWTPSCCPFGFPAGVFPLLKMTSRSPFGSATEYEPWSKSHLCGDSDGSKKFPKKHSVSDVPLMSSGVDQCRPPSVDIEPKIGDCWYWPVVSLKRNTVHVTYTLPLFGLDA